MSWVRNTSNPKAMNLKEDKWVGDSYNKWLPSWEWKCFWRMRRNIPGMLRASKPLQLPRGLRVGLLAGGYIFHRNSRNRNRGQCLVQGGPQAKGKTQKWSKKESTTQRATDLLTRVTALVQHLKRYSLVKVHDSPRPFLNHLDRTLSDITI